MRLTTVNNIYKESSEAFSKLYLETTDVPSQPCFSEYTTLVGPVPSDNKQLFQTEACRFKLDIRRKFFMMKMVNHWTI